MFNRNNYLAALITGLLIFVPIFSNAETLPEIEGIFQNHDVEKFTTFRSPDGMVDGYLIKSPRGVCYGSISKVEDDFALTFLNRINFVHPVHGATVTGFYFSVTSERPFPVMVIFTAIPEQLSACLDIVMILRGEDA